MSRVRSILAGVFIASFFGVTGYAQTIKYVLNAASYSNQLAPGTLASIFGADLSISTEIAKSLPLPTVLGGVSVTVGGIAAPLLYVAPGQINILIPFEIPIIMSSSVPTPIVITAPSGTVTTSIALQSVAPAVFTLGSTGNGTAIVLDSNFQLVNAVGSDPIILYATGLGSVMNPVQSASGASPSGPPDPINSQLSVQIGGNAAKVEFAGLAPGFPGVYQINVIPDSPSTSPLALSVNGVSAPPVTVPISGRGSQNITAAAGSITGLYPSTTTAQVLQSPIELSELLLAANFGVDVWISPNAQPFDIVAEVLPPSTTTSAAAQAIIHVDPVHGVWQAAIDEPTTQESSWDFGQLGVTVYDYSSCASMNACTPFEGNIVPQSRVDPAAAIALSYLPSALAVGGTLSESASMTSTSRFSIDGIQLMGLSNFGAFVPLGENPNPSQTITFQLAVDGVIIDNKMVTIQLER